MTNQWLAFALMVFCGLSLAAAGAFRVAWPSYVTAALFPPFVVLVSGSWLANDCFNEYFELNGWGQKDPLILAFLTSMTVFCAGLVYACRMLARTNSGAS
jgi:hypothetical protein